ncbi:MAG: ribosome assembly RNA-binding protein YhbY [Deltaproteobacteria bacterium]|nr:ribosome assembly RNA-binding protein YhbY [Deltaproteobacteria bacterium]
MSAGKTEITPLTAKDRRFLRGLGHALDPVVSIGVAGLSDAVVAQIDQALDHHELIKVRVGRAALEDKEKIDAEIAERVGCERVQRIGHALLLFREKEDTDQRKIWIPGRGRPVDGPEVRSGRGRGATAEHGKRGRAPRLTSPTR